MSAEENIRKSKEQLESIGETVDEKLLEKVVKGLGIANDSVDSSLVATSDKGEIKRVQKKFLEQKLKLMDDDEANEAALAEVSEKMAQFKQKNRGAFYYLLTKKFEKEDVYGC